MDSLCQHYKDQAGECNSYENGLNNYFRRRYFGDSQTRIHCRFFENAKKLCDESKYEKLKALENYYRANQHRSEFLPNNRNRTFEEWNKNS